MNDCILIYCLVTVVLSFEGWGIGLFRRDLRFSLCRVTLELKGGYDHLVVRV